MFTCFYVFKRLFETPKDNKTNKHNIFLHTPNQLPPSNFSHFFLLEDWAWVEESTGLIVMIENQHGSLSNEIPKRPNVDPQQNITYTATASHKWLPHCAAEPKQYAPSPPPPPYDVVCLWSEHFAYSAWASPISSLPFPSPPPSERAVLSLS